MVYVSLWGTTKVYSACVAAAAAAAACCRCLLLLLQVTADSPTNAVSVWDIINLSADSHPIHMHNVDFEV
jgi:FtsP/CotA-like multicopper oxidase with cupredoxin domain